jgi:PIN domain nuclease of toxin-antitoxin system
LKVVLLDTHTWAWSLIADPRLSANAVGAIQSAQSVLVSPITFFEIAQKVRLGKWPEIVPIIGRLPALLAEQGGAVAAMVPEICVSAGTMAWLHRDPFDRLLAATALHYGVPIVSADTIFDGTVARLW